MDEVKIMVVEDEHIVALDIKLHLEKFGYIVAAMYASGEEALSNFEMVNPDLVLMDIKLQGELDGVETSNEIKMRYGVPVILLTAFADEATIERAKITQPFAYIIKPFEEKELKTAIVIALYRHEMEKKLLSRERLFSTTLRSILDGVIVTDNEERVRYLNPVAEAMLRVNQDDSVGRLVHELVVLEEFKDEMLWEESSRDKYFSLRSSDSDLLVELNKSPLIEEGNSKEGSVWVLHDVTQQLKSQRALRESEYRLRQSQKMEALGRLSGGIAHDFNNLLTIIMGYSKMLLDGVRENEKFREDLEGIRTAALKSAALTRQLLVFSRQQIMKFEPTNLNTIIRDMEKMIRRLLSEQINVIFSPDAPQAMIYVDRGQVEQILINLAVNSRDAMMNGGILTIKTDNVAVKDRDITPYGEIPRGSYVVLTVKDTGVGIDKDELPKIFEPFYTTKESGYGTGLGLATVFGIVEQFKGYIKVESAPGEGTLFSIFLPLLEGKEEINKDTVADGGVYRGTESIMLVEDDDKLRELITRMLTSKGYHVIEAKNAGEALLICEENKKYIDLMISDLLMPHMDGYKLAQRLVKSKPDLKVLIISGYPYKKVKEQYHIDESFTFLQKPFDNDTLALTVRNILTSN